MLMDQKIKKLRFITSIARECTNKQRLATPQIPYGGYAGLMGQSSACLGLALLEIDRLWRLHCGRLMSRAWGKYLIIIKLILLF